MTTPLITPDQVRLDVSLGADKTEVIRGLAAVAAESGRTSDVEGLVQDALAREATSPTGLPGGIAIPHCRTEHVDVPTLVFARLSPGTDFGAKDGPADLAFLIAAPAGGDATHLEVLTQLARALVKPDFTNGLRDAETPADVVELVETAVRLPEKKAAPAPAPAPAGQSSASTAPGDGTATAAPGAAAAGAGAGTTTDRRRSIVAVTACPTGIAHTYMAAEALEAAAARAGVDIHVETQGSAGSTPLARETIAEADAAIFAADVGVRDRTRFAGKPVVASGVKRAIDDGDKMIAEALRYADDPDGPRVEGSADAAAAGGSSGGKESWGARTRRVLMTGVSYMIPFVAAGGLLIALAFLLGGYEIALSTGADGSGPGVAGELIANGTLLNPVDVSTLELANGAALPNGDVLSYIAALLLTLGSASFGFLVPALAGYIAYAIADRPGIAPGFVMGFIANTTLASGFLGGIVGGVLAGVVAAWIAGWKVPTWARGLMPVVVIPLLATLISGAIMVIVLGRPLTALTEALNDALNSLDGGSAVVLGVVLGLMMAFDMGGPLNKTAYAFATAGLTAAAIAAGDAPELRIMAAVMLAGMVPPLALALATVIRPGLFTVAERENGKAAWLLGASFITEGAIPFAAGDPLRVIPSIMAGSAVTGALSMAFGVTLAAPHGGVFVFFAIGELLGFFIALVAGVLVAAGLVVVLKQFTSSRDVEDIAVTA
jgi:PTS system fructose-specific IIC component